jgi:alpha-glucosidase (family GH31 glycosyl hydrolase)
MPIDPGIKVEKGYEAYDSGVKKDIFLEYSDGQYYDFDGQPTSHLCCMASRPTG